MNHNNCFFIGHREVSTDIFPQLKAEILRHIIEYGVTEFTVGHYGQFDAFAAQAVREVKKVYPNITLFLRIPYHPTEHSIEVPDGFDGTFYPPDMESIPKRFAIVHANRYMIKNCTHLIAYAGYSPSNAKDLVAYALKHKKCSVCNLFCQVHTTSNLII